MKKIIYIAMSLILLLNIPVFADRNETRRKNNEISSQQTTETLKDLPSKLSEKLDGYLVIKTENNVIYASGKAEKIDVPAFSENNAVYIPSAAAADFFGKKAVWDAETSSVKIDETVIYPSQNSKITDGRTMTDASALADVLGVKTVYSDEDTIILGMKDMAQEIIDEVTAALRDKFYVLPDTSKKGDGTKENPYGGLNAAVLALREYTKKGMNTNITVYLREGLYVHKDAVRFTTEDSGKNGYTITYKSYPGETAEIAAAEKVEGWKPYKDGIYMARINASRPVNVLYENDLFAYKARYPNLGDKPYRDYYLRSAGYDKSSPNRFYFNSGDLPYIDDRQGLQAAMFGGGENGEFNWWMEVYNAQIDYRRKSLTLTTAPIRVMGKGSRFFIQGSLELLDQKGEFYYNESSKMIYYKPFNDDINAQTITYATANSPIILEGTKENNIKNIAFEELKIGKSNTNTELRAAMDEAITFKYADNCAIRNCEILLTGCDAVWMNNCKNCDISGNYMHDLGSAAVKCEADDLYGEIVYTGNKINNNYIKNVGLIKREASGIFIKNTDYGEIMYNHVEASPRIGIQFSTGYEAQSLVGSTIRGTKVDELNMFEFRNCTRNHIAYNDVTDVETDTQDGGAIYTWGAGMYNLVENNHVHDVDFPNVGGHSVGYPYYGDDSSGYTIYNKNLADNNQQYGDGTMLAVLITKSVGHTITNNFFLNNPNAAKGAYSTETKNSDPHNNITYVNNLTMNSSDNLHGQWKWYDDRFKKCDYNFYYNDSGKYLIYNNDKAKNLDEWKRINTDYGYMDNNSISGENPCFVDYENRDYRLRYDSPAYSIGIDDIDERDIGVREDFKFADKEGELKKLYLETSTDGLSANVRVNTGGSSQIKPEARTVDGFFANLDNAEITYSSSDENIARVSENGLITGVGTGIAEITVSASKNGKTISSNLFVLVNDRFVGVDVKLASNIVDKGDTTDVIGVGKSEMGYSMVLNEKSYSSSDQSVAKIDESGKITAVSAGTATITVTGKYNGVTQSGSAVLTILNGVLDNITIKAEKNDGILTGEKVQLDFDAVLTTGVKVEHKDVKISYTSGDDKIISVDENGVMTGISEGRTTVTLSLEKDGFKKSADLLVSVFDTYSGKLGDGWKETNFGTSHGYADFRSDGTVLLRSTGDDFYGTADDGYYLYKEVNGNDVTIEMSVKSLLETSSNAAVGLTIRESASPESRNYTIRTLRGGAVISVWRDENGGECGYAQHDAGKYPLKLKIEKKGSSIKSYIDFGDGYKEAYSKQMNFDSYTVGIPMFSQYPLSTEAIISDLKVTE